MSQNKNPQSKGKNPAHAKKSDGQQGRSSQVAVHASHTSYSGPIPNAAELAKYNDVVPGAAERILQMAEKNLQHQIHSETLVLNAKRGEVRLGQIFAFLITLSAFSVCIAAMILGFPSVASIVGGTTVLGLAVAFIKGRESSSKA